VRVRMSNENRHSTTPRMTEESSGLVLMALRVENYTGNADCVCYNTTDNAVYVRAVVTVSVLYSIFILLLLCCCNCYNNYFRRRFSDDVDVKPMKGYRPVKTVEEIPGVTRLEEKSTALP
jgi:hypothetical protein